MNIRHCTVQVIGNNIYIVKKGIILAAFAATTKTFLRDNPTEHNGEAIYSALKFGGMSEKAKSVLDTFVNAKEKKAEPKPKQPKTTVAETAAGATASTTANTAASESKPIRVEPMPK